ncbi:peroxiredoxin [Leptospira perolatii]|uniref:Peroxiredoxin n=1 Tax=Leptospira perolatii TaxID=2023191 RepID=A0A2M9ZMY5_9LEPT|nr:SelL-related redox protein [Leptospira perolatii]PJZ68954.1 peroxiredoxin [Leptospira perolatii]PJZ73428.1 peroxiredoxin [Leptospira perolatii]
MEFLPKEIMDFSVEGRNLVGQHFRDNLPARPALVIFLRHLGCIFCRELVTDLRSLQSNGLNLPPILFVFPDSKKEGDEFFSRFWPEASAVANPDVSLYGLAEISDGNLLELAGPEVWISALRAAIKGNFYGVQSRNILQMPRIFLVLKDRILWTHVYRHIGDHPDWSQIPGYSNPVPADLDPGILPA